MVGEISLRKATRNDSGLLLEWRNDNETRKMLGHDFADRDEHNDWINKIIGSPDNLLLIAESEGEPIGALRLDLVSDAESSIEFPDFRLVSFVVAPERRRQGYGMGLMKEGCISYGQEYSFLAKTKEGNVAARKILEACSFALLGEVQDGVFAYLRNSGSARAQTLH